jgi:uncharacterized protein (DUF58 family)
MRRPSPARQGPGPIPAPALRRLGLTLRRRIAGRLPGDQPTRGTAGDGTELAQLAQYAPGDDVRRLDPSASARTGEPHVRRMVPERAVTTWLVVDVSPSMAFGTTTRLKSDVAQGAADVIARLATRHGGSVSLTVAAGADDAPVLPPKSGKHALAGLRRALEAGVAQDGVRGNLAQALERAARLAKATGVVAVLSDFRGEGWETPLRALGARHSVLAIELRDPMEDALPDAGTVAFVDPETGDLVDLDTSDRRLRELVARAEEERRARVAKTLRRAGARHVVLRTDDDWLRELGRVLR